MVAFSSQPVQFLKKPLVWTMLLSLPFAINAQANEDPPEEITEEGVEVEPAYAVLYPWFILAMGIVSYFVLSRYAAWMPYTAILFLIGTLIGVTTRHLEKDPNQLSLSIEYYWMEIDSEVLLLTFLPGLVFSDSTGLNTYLFERSFFQLIIFAFPLVLGGTALTALVAFYLFPYNWSFNLAMTFGSILSATDPVAVSALLEQVGAPPRLKTHIAGESLLNDGSAMVFFTIFSQLYLLELGVPGLGTEVDGKGGVALFCRMALGGMAVGMFFAFLMICILHSLKWRLNREENVTEVAASITIAYLTYYTADTVWGTSGVIAVVTLGVTVAAFGKGLINDLKLYEDFWSMIEWFLNTVLFSLGGLVWGSIISNNDPDYPELVFTGTDWGYVFVNYVMLTAIRYLLLVGAYPVTSRIGLGSSLPEMFFQAYGGLRGAVGISLAIFLENIVRKATLEGQVEDVKYLAQTHKLFGHIGGIAFLTLMINGVTAGPVLKKLGLAETTDIRKRMLHCYEAHVRLHVIYDFVSILSMTQWDQFQVNKSEAVAQQTPVSDVVDHGKRLCFSVGIVQKHLPMFIGNMTRREFLAATERFVSDHPEKDHSVLRRQVELIVPHLEKKRNGSDEEKGMKESGNENSDEDDRAEMMHIDELTKRFAGRSKKRQMMKDEMQMRHTVFAEKMSLIECRRVFLEIVRARYAAQNKMGEVLDREFVYFSLTQSLDIAASHVAKGPLTDWKYVDLVEQSWLDSAKAVKHKIRSVLPTCKGLVAQSIDPELYLKRINIEQCVFFIRAHMDAQEFVKEQLEDDIEFAPVVKDLLAESEAEVELAAAKLASYDRSTVSEVMSHKIIRVLLNNIASFIEELAESGLLKEQEATGYLEKVQEILNQAEVGDDDADGNDPRELRAGPVGTTTSRSDPARSKSVGRSIATGSLSPKNVTQ